MDGVVSTKSAKRRQTWPLGLLVAHIASFRRAAKFGPLSRPNGFWRALSAADLWVHGLRVHNGNGPCIIGPGQEETYYLDYPTIARPIVRQRSYTQG
jgi:hypothetical protein